MRSRAASAHCAFGFVLLCSIATAMAMCGVFYTLMRVEGRNDADVFGGGLCERGEVVRRCAWVGRATLMCMRIRGE